MFQKQVNMPYRHPILIRLRKMAILFSCLFSLNTLQAQNILKVGDLKCEYQEMPLGVESAAPRLSWKIFSEDRNILQTAYQIQVADSKEQLQNGNANMWNPGKLHSAESILITYRGKPLQAGREYFWRVQVWDNKGKSSGWSKINSWRMGLLNESDWMGAKWIAYEQLSESKRIVPAVHMRGNFEEKKDVLPLLRKKFSVRSPIKRATAFVSGLGHFDFSMNGIKVGDHFLDPGWTQYDKHALYATFDLTDKIKQGDNAIGAILGNGFYFIPRDKRYRKLTGAYGYPKFLCRLVIEYSNGRVEDIISDETWRTSPSPITYTSIYGGEDYDANLEQQGWDKATFDDSKWKKALIVDGPPVLNSQTAEPLKIFESFNPVKVTQPKPGIWVYDMGQNASAIPAIVTQGEKNSVVRIRPGELLNKDGTVNQSASGDPHYYEYTLKGTGEEKWQPKFTYYGFRYIQIEGAVPQSERKSEKLPVMIAVKSRHVRNAAPSAGSFSSSSELFNKTYKLIDWAIRSNMASVLTDCPHREKLGWLEQAHLMGPSIQYNYNIATLNRKIVKDMIAAQTPEGLVPDIAPEYTQFNAGFRDSPEWGSNAIIQPWYMFQWYGDKEALKESYPMMKMYIAYLSSKADAHILSHGLGDWFDIGPKRPGEAQLTPKAVTATAIYYYDLTIASEVAKLLGYPQDAAEYSTLASQVKTAFNKRFFNSQTNQYSTGSQTANAMAVYMNLVEKQNEKAVVDNLVKEIRSRNNSLTAGDIGYRYVLRVLEAAGHSDVIYNMNSRTDVPGYGWQLDNGATALTESWQAYGFVSNNHLMLGHLMEWFYSGLGGIRSAPGSLAFKKIQIRPEPVGNVTSANVQYESLYGTVSSKWNKTGSVFRLEIVIPSNTTATVFLPARFTANVFEGERTISSIKGLSLKPVANGRLPIEIGSGKYVFEVRN